tara:strand:+ start:156 stop:548 length:393 start_codon:yes stop_codon:yes gene_type:complete
MTVVYPVSSIKKMPSAQLICKVGRKSIHAKLSKIPLKISIAYSEEIDRLPFAGDNICIKKNTIYIKAKLERNEDGRKCSIQWNSTKGKFVVKKISNGALINEIEIPKEGKILKNRDVIKIREIKFQFISS